MKSKNVLKFLLKKKKLSFKSFYKDFEEKYFSIFDIAYFVTKANILYTVKFTLSYNSMIFDKITELCTTITIVLV